MFLVCFLFLSLHVYGLVALDIGGNFICLKVKLATVGKIITLQT